MKSHLFVSLLFCFCTSLLGADTQKSLDGKLREIIARSEKLTKESVSDNELWFEAWKKRDQESPPQLGTAEGRGDGGVWILACIKYRADGSRQHGWFQLVGAEEWRSLVEEVVKLNRRVDFVERKGDDNSRRIALLEERIRYYEESMDSRATRSEHTYYESRGRGHDCEPEPRVRRCYSSPPVHYSPPPVRYCPPVCRPPVYYEEPCEPRCRSSFGVGLGFERKNTFFGLGLFFRKN